jgi:hypothetical protein
MPRKKTTAPEVALISQTDIEMYEFPVTDEDSGAANGENPVLPQTDSELNEVMAERGGGGSKIDRILDSLQAEIDSIPSESSEPPGNLPEEKSIKKLRKKKDAGKPPELEASEPSVQPQSDSTPEKPKAPPRKRSRTDAVVSIDKTRSVETSADRRNNDLLDLVESMKGRKILSGTIQGVERSEDNSNLSYAVIYHGDFKVIIPASELVEPPSDFRERSPADVMHYMITKRLGAEIDYIVKGVDKTGIAAASRLEAMAAKRKEYYFGTDRDGNNRLYEGLIAEARVIAVIRAGVFIDLFGVETYIALRELSYQRGLDAAAQFQPGQRVLVKILELDRSDRNNIRVNASIKQASENPYEKALRKFVVGNRYVGTVSLVDTNGVFVSMDGGIDCLCTYPKRGRPPRGSRVTVRIVGINHETNRIWGAITHMTTTK